MKIAFFINEFPSYSETFVVNQIIGLIGLGFDVTIVTTKIHQEISLRLVEDHRLMERVVVLPISRGKGIKGKLITIIDILKSLPNKKLREYLFEDIKNRKSGAIKLSSLVERKISLTFDAIIAHFGPNAVTAMRLTELGILSGKIHAVFHGYDMSKRSYVKRLMPAYKKLFSTNMLALPVSHYWENKLIEFGCPKNKIIVNRMGIDIEQFNFAPKAMFSNPIEIITVARHTEKKGIEYAIKAMLVLKARNIKFTYSVIGTGPLLEQHQALIKSLSLSDEIKLLGFKNQDEINLLLEQADIFLLPSVTSSSGNQEGIPVSLMEAMAKGVICLSTFHSGIPELITNEVSGFLVPERDATAISKMVLRILECDALLIQNNARKCIEEEFSQLSAYRQLNNILLNQA